MKEKKMTMADKVAAINGYNEFVGSIIRYEMYGNRFYRCENCELWEDYDEVSPKHINDAYDEVAKRVAKILQ